MALEYLHSLMESSMRGFIKKIKSMDSEFTLGLTENVMKDGGQTVNKTDLAYIFIMIKSSMLNGEMEQKLKSLKRMKLSN